MRMSEEMQVFRLIPLIVLMVTGLLVFQMSAIDPLLSPITGIIAMVLSILFAYLPLPSPKIPSLIGHVLTAMIFGCSVILSVALGVFGHIPESIVGIIIIITMLLFLEEKNATIKRQHVPN